MSQDKIEEKIKDRTKLCAAIQNDITSLASKLGKLSESDLALYQMLHGPDALFGDSPLSPLKTASWAKEFMIKKDMDFIGFVLDGKPSIKTFNERMEEASGWALRFTKEKPKTKTGIDAILKES